MGFGLINVYPPGDLFVSHVLPGEYRLSVFKYVSDLRAIAGFLGLGNVVEFDYTGRGVVRLVKLKRGSPVKTTEIIDNSHVLLEDPDSVIEYVREAVEELENPVVVVVSKYHSLWMDRVFSKIDGRRKTRIILALKEDRRSSIVRSRVGGVNTVVTYTKSHRKYIAVYGRQGPRYIGIMLIGSMNPGYPGRDDYLIGTTPTQHKLLLPGLFRALFII